MVYEDLDYLTYVIEHVTHGHINFNSMDDQEKIDLSVTRKTMEFLDNLFNDRVLIGIAKDRMGSVLTTLTCGEPENFMEPG